MSIRTMLGLAVVLLCPRPGHAEWEGQTLWDKGAAELMELADRAKHLVRPSSIACEKPVETSVLESKLDEVKEDIGFAKNSPPGLGVFFDQTRSTVVSQLLINGPAERCGIRIGDEFQTVNGHDVSDDMDIGRWAKQGDAVEIVLKGRASKVTVEKKAPELLSPELAKEIDAEYAAVRAGTEDLKRRRQDPGHDLCEVSAASRDLLSRIKRLGDKLTKAQTDRYRKT